MVTHRATVRIMRGARIGGLQGRRVVEPVGDSMMRWGLAPRKG
jgi:hypothetical protein